MPDGNKGEAFDQRWCHQTADITNSISMTDTCYIEIIFYQYCRGQHCNDVNSVIRWCTPPSL